MTPKSVPKDEFISGVAPLGAPLVAQTAFGHQKLAPSAPKVLPMIENSAKNNTKEPPDCEKELPNSSFFGTWPGGLREALAINIINQLSNAITPLIDGIAQSDNGITRLVDGCDAWPGTQAPTRRPSHEIAK